MKSVSPLQQRTILIVEDEPELREAMAYEFSRRGCTTFEAGNGEEALAIIMNNTIDIVVSDIRMPKSDGVDLLKKVRAAFPRLPVVLLATGFSDLSEPEAINMGALALLEKPIDRKKMISLLENACAVVFPMPA